MKQRRDVRPATPPARLEPRVTAPTAPVRVAEQLREQIAPAQPVPARAVCKCAADSLRQQCCWRCLSPPVSDAGGRVASAPAAMAATRLHAVARSDQRRYCPTGCSALLHWLVATAVACAALLPACRRGRCVQPRRAEPRMTARDEWRTQVPHGDIAVRIAAVRVPKHAWCHAPCRLLAAWLLRGLTAAGQAQRRLQPRSAPRPLEQRPSSHACTLLPRCWCPSHTPKSGDRQLSRENAAREGGVSRRAARQKQQRNSCKQAATRDQSTCHDPR